MRTIVMVVLMLLVVASARGESGIVGEMKTVSSNGYHVLFKFTDANQTMGCNNVQKDYAVLYIGNNNSANALGQASYAMLLYAKQKGLTITIVTDGKPSCNVTSVVLP